MASGISVIVKALNIKEMHVDYVDMNVESVTHCGEAFDRLKIDLDVRPYKRIRGQCPICRKKCPGYDHKQPETASWRANALNGVPVFLHYRPQRIQCPEHGVKTEYLPWADGRSRFTEGFNNEIAFMALNAPKTVVSQYMDVNWRTVGNAIKAAHDRIEPDVSQRLRGLKRFCVDETSRRKGHTYITVVYDIDRNRVAWLHDGHGLEVFKQFCESLTEEERKQVEVVAGDGARWIDECVNEYFPQARRCVDFFHVVGWATEALDKVRLNALRRAKRDVNEMREKLEALEKEEEEERRKIEEEYLKVKKELEAFPSKGRPSAQKKELMEYLEELRSKLEKEPADMPKNVTKEEYEAAKEELETMPKKRRGRHSKRENELLRIIEAYEGKAPKKKSKKRKLSPEHQAIIDELNEKSKQIKGSKYALGMNPENLSESMKDKLKLIEGSYPEVYKAYRLKEQLRIILHMKDKDTAEKSLNDWIKDSRKSGFEPFKDLSEKIERHKDNILSAVELQVNSSKSEATNTTIKALIKMARGFRNLENMFALIYLRCSSLVIPLFNRWQPSEEVQKTLRDLANKRRHEREEGRRLCAMQN